MTLISSSIVLRTFILGLAMLLLPCNAVLAKTTLASVFTDNMVLQRERPMSVWGWAEPGESITVTFAGQKKTTTAASDRRWMVRLDPLVANSQPAELTIIGANTLTVRNVLVGEVWLCGGQSNMGLSLRECFDAPQEIAAAGDPQLRLLAAAAAGAVLPADNLAAGSWKVCTPETAAGFAATAYFFGRALRRELKVPIGLIEFDRGSTGIECWVPLDAYQASATPALQEIATRVASWNPKSEIGRKVHAEKFKEIAAWLPLARKALDEHRPAPPQPRMPAPDQHQANPCEAFNGTIHPLVPFAVRGAAWYQGESNPGEGEIYAQKMKAMILGWRKAWGQEIPFYFVQLANEGNPNHDPAEGDTFRYVPVREAQRRALELPRTGMAVAIDLGEDASGHPRNKRDVGERLALWALANDYKHKVPFTGPLYRGSRIEGDRMILSFDHVDRGLMVGDKDGLKPVREVPGAALKHFAIAGADGKWHWGDAQIVDKTVVVRSDKVPHPVKLRYAYSMNPKGPKLYNRDGLPASPFRTDAW